MGAGGWGPGAGGRGWGLGAGGCDGLAGAGLGWVGLEIDGLGGSTPAMTSNFYLFLAWGFRV